MLSTDQLQQFDEQGYLVVDGVIDPEKTRAPLVAEYEAIMDRLVAQWKSQGSLDAVDFGGSFEQRIIAAYRAGLEYFQPMDISLPAGDIREDTPFHAGPAAFGLLTDNRLLDAVEDLIGPEITSTPIQHVRIKPPMDLRQDENRAHLVATDWHQDRGVALEEADQSRMVTAWVAVNDATVANGCLRVVPGSHRGDMKQHCPNPQARIPDQFIDLDAAQPLPVKAGGVIFFHPLTIHSSLDNMTAGIRWSFDLRYIVTGDPTGRPAFPSFVARSRSKPDTELRDADAWRTMWEEARRRLAKAEPLKIHRWGEDALICA